MHLATPSYPPHPFSWPYLEALGGDSQRFSTPYHSTPWKVWKPLTSLPQNHSYLPYNTKPLFLDCGERKMLGSLRINGGRQWCRGDLLHIFSLFQGLLYWWFQRHPFKCHSAQLEFDVHTNRVGPTLRGVVWYVGFKNRELHTMFLGLLLGASYNMSLVFTYLYTTNKQRS